MPGLSGASYSPGAARPNQRQHPCPRSGRLESRGHRAEARLAGALGHENIAQVYDYGEQAGEQMPYLVTELADGPSVEAALAGARWPAA
jgi:serine/threonine protein kinase